MAECDADCLHCAINELVVQRLQKHLDDNTDADPTEMAVQMAQSLAEMIVHAAPPDEQARLLAYALQHVGSYFMQESIRMATN
jgi:hypothetical protein